MSQRDKLLTYHLWTLAKFHLTCQNKRSTVTVTMSCLFCFLTAAGGCGFFRQVSSIVAWNMRFLWQLECYYGCLTAGARYTARGLASSPRPSLPHSSPLLCQHQTSSITGTGDSPLLPETARPYDEIPKTPTTLGLNLELIRRPFKIVDYFRRVAAELGPIFKVAGTPGLTSMVCVVHPKDVETVFRAGDTDYPERILVEVWRDSLKELNAPSGMFLA